MELPDSESVYACACVCPSVCLSTAGARAAEGRDRSSALTRPYQRGAPSSCSHPLTSPTLVSLWGLNG